MRIKKHSLSLLAALLLLCFSATVLPLDALHNHGAFRTSASPCKYKSGQTCSHKNHLSTRTTFCWACAIHLEKVFIKDVQVTQLRSLVFSDFGGRTTLLFSKNIPHFHILRGPPLV